MILLVGFQSSKSVKQEKETVKADKSIAIKQHIRERYVACPGKVFEVVLTVETLQQDISADTEYWATTEEIKNALTELGFDLKKVGDKRIAYARRVSVL